NNYKKNFNVGTKLVVTGRY
uniref:Uncharacterized protein n=2 Tax=Bos TaxID=9903 RepID=A0AAA9TM45_BOVIN